jgi:hypothetical protein
MHVIPVTSQIDWVLYITFATYGTCNSILRERSLLRRHESRRLRLRSLRARLHMPRETVLLYARSAEKNGQHFFSRFGKDVP